MNVLFAIIGAGLSTAIPGIAVYLASRRGKKTSDIAEELSSLHNEVDRLQSHVEKIQQKIEEEQTMRARAH
jgi:peptidoglycan hydrolase CwlO-like protein